ncbi:MAG: hypothetical protein E6G50_05015 [Actinobacteria bacterium]|nr:MAG: hypothetical protein E6G50_05015 [Actinomycetota bacterium]
MCDLRHDELRLRPDTEQQRVPRGSRVLYRRAGLTPARDYEAEDVLVVDKPDQLRALADDLRATIIALLRERARSTQELSG